MTDSSLDTVPWCQLSLISPLSPLSPHPLVQTDTWQTHTHVSDESPSNTTVGRSVSWLTHKLSSQRDERPSNTSVFRVVNWLQYKSSSFSEASPAKTPSGSTDDWSRNKTWSSCPCPGRRWRTLPWHSCTEDPGITYLYIQTTHTSEYVIRVRTWQRERGTGCDSQLYQRENQGPFYVVFRSTTQRVYFEKTDNPYWKELIRFQRLTTLFPFQDVTRPKAASHSAVVI